MNENIYIHTKIFPQEIINYFCIIVSINLFNIVMVSS